MQTYLRTFVLVSLSVIAFPHCATSQRAADTRKVARAADPAIPRPKVRLIGMSDKGADDKLTTLAQYKVLRRVSMHYRLDLLKDNALSPAIAGLMRVHDDRVRECYLTRLERNPDLRGQVSLRFQVSKATGQMERIARIGGSLDDGPLVDCMTRELAVLPLNPPKALNGRLLYSFNTEETLARAP